ncbi:MAG: universal stress protein [Chloroflexi bacterium]|nr:universal stress protein [Chloroflexota bacterium]
MYNRILVPLDGSALAEAALPHAHMLAAPANGEIILLRVVTYSLHDIAEHDPHMDGTLADDLKAVRADAELYLHRLATRLQPRERVRAIVLDNARAADAIIACASEQAVDLIVMTTHGRTGVVRWLLGSVADRVARQARAPVLLVRSTPVARAA